MKKINTIIFIFVSIALLFSFNRIDKKEDKKEVKITTPTEALVLKLKQEALVEKVTAFGQVKNDNQLSLSLQTNGRVELLNVENGKFVHKGELLLSLDKTIQNNNIEQLLREKEKINYSLNSLKLEQQNYQKSLDATARLHSDGIATLEEKENAQLKFDLVNNELKIKKEGLKTINNKIDVATFNSDQYSLKAPENGIVEKIFIKQHEQIRAGQNIIIFSPSGKKATVNLKLTAKEIAKVKKGQKATIDIDLPSVKNYQGLVKAISYNQEGSNNYYNVLITFSITKNSLVYGSLVKVDILTDAKSNGYKIPLDAVDNVWGNTITLLTLQKDSTLQKIQFEYKDIKDQHVLINTELYEELDIVIDKSINLKETEKVQIIKYKDNSLVQK